MESARTFYQIWRFVQMYRETMGMIKGIGVGIAAAAAVTAVGAKMMKDNKRLRRSEHRAKDAVGQAAGDMANNVASMMK